MFRAHFSSGPKPFYVITEMQPERTTQDRLLTTHTRACARHARVSLHSGLHGRREVLDEAASRQSSSVDWEEEGQMRRRAKEAVKRLAPGAKAGPPGTRRGAASRGNP